MQRVLVEGPSRKDPDVVINASDGSVTMTGTCDRFVVTGGEVKLQIEAVKRIAINAQ